MAEDLEAAGLWPMKEYIWRRQATIKEYITNHPIYKLCTGEDRFRDIEGYCSGGIRISPRRRRATALGRERIGR